MCLFICSNCSVLVMQELQRDRRQPVYQVIPGYEHLPQVTNSFVRHNSAVL